MFKKHKSSEAIQSRNDDNEFDDKMMKNTKKKLHNELNKLEESVRELSENISNFRKLQSGIMKNKATSRQVKKKYKVIKD